MHWRNLRETHLENFLFCECYDVVAFAAAKRKREDVRLPRVWSINMQKVEWYLWSPLSKK